MSVAPSVRTRLGGETFVETAVETINETIFPTEFFCMLAASSSASTNASTSLSDVSRGLWDQQIAFQNPLA